MATSALPWATSVRTEDGVALWISGRSPRRRETSAMRSMSKPTGWPPCRLSKGGLEVTDAATRMPGWTMV